MTRIKINRRLPEELIIPSIDDILYSIGLCHSSVREDPKRSKLHNPIVIAFVVFTQLVMKIIALFTDDELLLSILTEFCHLLELIFHPSVMIIIISIIILFSQWVYFSNHRMGVKPTFIVVLGVMSGSVTPLSVGLTHETQVRQLLKYGKWLKRLLFLN